jgi:hypothetical protein
MFGKKDDGPLCYIDKKPCIKERCMKWQVAPVEKTVDGAKTIVMHEDCGENWMLLYLKGIANRTDGTQASIESFRNAMVEANEATARLMRGAVLAVGAQRAIGNTAD